MLAEQLASHKLVLPRGMPHELTGYVGTDIIRLILAGIGRRGADGIRFRGGYFSGGYLSPKPSGTQKTARARPRDAEFSGVDHPATYPGTSYAARATYAPGAIATNPNPSAAAPSAATCTHPAACTATATATAKNQACG